jgi:hypothetical protein
MAIGLPKDVNKKYGQFVLVQARYENFFRALFRSRSSEQKTQEKILAEAQAEVEEWMADPAGKRNLF